MVAKPSHVVVNVDGLACPLHHPTVCGRQMRGQSFMSNVDLFHRTEALLFDVLLTIQIPV
jgi:hypothetical protein